MHAVSAQTSQLTVYLQADNTAVNQAFSAVLAAEKAGANVTSLLSQLNVVAGNLAQAENSYRSGNYSAAAIQADNVLPTAQQITTAAQYAKQAAIGSGQNTFWSTIAFTLIGISIFVVVLSLVWRWFRRRYFNNLFQSKPKVNIE